MKSLIEKLEEEARTYEFADPRRGALDNAIAIVRQHEAEHPGKSEPANETLAGRVSYQLRNGEPATLRDGTYGELHCVDGQILLVKVENPADVVAGIKYLIRSLRDGGSNWDMARGIAALLELGVAALPAQTPDGSAVLTEEEKREVVEAIAARTWVGGYPMASTIADAEKALTDLLKRFELRRR